MMGKLKTEGRLAVISGASGGIGGALAGYFIGDGCRVIGIGRNEEKLKALQEKLGDGFSYRVFDVSSRAAWERLRDELLSSGEAVDFLVNNAGVLPSFDRFREGSGVETCEETVRVNYLSAAYAISAMMPLLRRSDAPAVLNVASAAALCSMAGSGAYSASKAALRAFTETLAAEERKWLSVTLACPGFTKTGIFRGQKNASENKWIARISADLEKTSRKIYKAFLRKRLTVSPGVDTALLRLLRFFTGSRAPRVIHSFLAMVDDPLFRDVFAE